MKALILAAGYATRLFPLTKDFPKPLLEVGGQTILDHLMDQLETVQNLSQVHIVTNSRFTKHFKDWAQSYDGLLPITIIDDGTSSNEDRLGAVGDIRFAIETSKLADELLVCAADNILQFPLVNFVAAFKANPVTYICVRSIEDIEDRRRRGIVLLDAANQVLEFEEKPDNPKSKWAVPPFYIYPAKALKRVNEFLDEGGTSDAPGHFVEWLCQKDPVFAYKIEGEILDIGNHDSLAEARSAFGE